MGVAFVWPEMESIVLSGVVDQCAGPVNVEDEVLASIPPRRESFRINRLSYFILRDDLRARLELVQAK
jgi:hypothetical protein